MLHNDKNTPPFPVIQGPVIVVMTNAPLKSECLCCGEKL
jgi:hypothetical protein